MKKSNLFTVTGEYWFFHPIGTGTIFTYHTKAKQILITCNATGRMLNVIDRYREGGFNSHADFKKEAKGLYLNMITEGVSMDLDFYEHPNFVGEGMVEVDFKLLMN
ncbi:MAG: hypothetical protein AABY15_06705 [Nanoarchaeota archaeon]